MLHQGVKTGKGLLRAVGVKILNGDETNSVIQQIRCRHGGNDIGTGEGHLQGFPIPHKGERHLCASFSAHQIFSFIQREIFRGLSVHRHKQILRLHTRRLGRAAGCDGGDLHPILRHLNDYSNAHIGVIDLLVVRLHIIRADIVAPLVAGGCNHRRCSSVGCGSGKGFRIIVINKIVGEVGLDLIELRCNGRGILHLACILRLQLRHRDGVGQSRSCGHQKQDAQYRPNFLQGNSPHHPLDFQIKTA